MLVEQRKDERIPVRFEVKLATGTEEREGTLMDISRGGAQVATSEALLRPETEVRVIVQRRSGSPIVLSGRVRWSNSARFAIAFTQLDSAAYGWLSSILEEDGTAIR
jgi:hypothetical protein